ncbi:MAG: response regulator transcription factor [Chloroflexi bacterium]|nr:response regulator transcription factor [Chloroflexota bacterium]
MNDDALILLVDDQVDHLQAIQLLLEGVGYRVVTCTSGADALHILASHPVSIILADVAMAQMNGYQLLEAVRRQPQWNAVPFIFLTARALDSDIRYGKALGVDDYLTKPIQPEDLLAVVEGKLRRREQLVHYAARSATASPDTSLRVGRIQIDLERHRVLLDGQPTTLSVREFALLERLARQPGVIVPARDLVEATHGLHTNDADEARELIRPLVRSLRQKLGDVPGAPGSIETVRGLGYRMIENPGD